MNAQFNQRALDLSVQEYTVLRNLGDPVSPAAFGIAVLSLQRRLNINTLNACEMLRLELDRVSALRQLAQQSKQTPEV